MPEETKKCTKSYKIFLEVLTSCTLTIKKKIMVKILVRGISPQKKAYTNSKEGGSVGTEGFII